MNYFFFGTPGHSLEVVQASVHVSWGATWVCSLVAGSDRRGFDERSAEQVRSGMEEDRRQHPKLADGQRHP